MTHWMNQKKNLPVKEIAKLICERNVDEQLTELFEIDNDVDFENQTPDEISLIMLQKMGISKRGEY